MTKKLATCLAPSPVLGNGRSNPPELELRLTASVQTGAVLSLGASGGILSYVKQASQ